MKRQTKKKQREWGQWFLVLFFAAFFIWIGMAIESIGSFASECHCFTKNGAYQ